jgi:hypothetical protein
MSSIIFYCLLLFLWVAGVCQARPAGPDDRVMFYNLENLFDPLNDSTVQDDDFTPEGRYHWSWSKLRDKTHSIAKTIIAAGEGDAPVLVGVCEAENRLVLQRLVEQTPLQPIGYGIVHRDSPDPRGIDVALLYRADAFTLLDAAWFRVYYDSGSYRTREILYAKGVLHELDTLHVVVTHWPSKMGGAARSEPRRMRAAATLRAITDSLFSTNPRANIIVMGDFNDTPDSAPVVRGLQAVSDTSCVACLHNLMRPLAARGEGSLKYRAAWELIDLFFVSGNLLNAAEPIYCPPEDVAIFRAPFLLEPDERYLGEKVRRTHDAGGYKGGASDHLPIVMRIKRNW